MNNLLKIILICSPFLTYIFIGKPILTTQALLSIALEIVVIFLFVLGLWNKRSPDLKAPMLFFAYILLASVWIIGKRLFLDDRLSALIRPLLHVSVFFLFYFALCHILDNKIYADIAKVIIYPAVAVSAICIFQKFGIDMFKYSQGWINGTLGNPTNNAMYLSACLPFIFLHKRPLLPLIFLFTAMFFCASASALVSAIAIIFIYLLAKKEYILLFVLAIFLSIAAIIFKEHLPSFFNPFEKFIIWEKALESWKQRYLFGWGIDAFRNLHLIYNNSLYDFTHNHYIWILHSFGLVGFGLFINWMCSLRFVFNPYDIRFTATLSLISVAIMGMISVPMRVEPVVILTAFNLAILTMSR